MKTQEQGLLLQNCTLGCYHSGIQPNSIPRCYLPAAISLLLFLGSGTQLVLHQELEHPLTYTVLRHDLT